MLKSCKKKSVKRADGIDCQRGSSPQDWAPCHLQHGEQRTGERKSELEFQFGFHLKAFTNH